MSRAMPPSEAWTVRFPPLAAVAFALLVSFGATAFGSPDRRAIEIVGHGPAAVFESGQGEGGASWAKVVAALRPCLTIVTSDRPGIGDGSALRRPEVPVLAAEVADHLLALLRAHRLTPPYILVGHSLGGLYAQAFARLHPRLVAGLVLVDATSPLEPPGVFVSTVPPKPGTIAAAEDAGVAPSIAAMRKGPKLPPVPLVVIAATDHHDTPAREALWRDVQRRTAALSPKGRLVIAESGHFVQIDRPAVVIAAVLSVAAAAGDDIAACRR